MTDARTLTDQIAAAPVPGRIVIRNASKTYRTRDGTVPALDRLSFSVNDGEFVSILGPSGCGKSTLLWAIAGLKPLDGGEIVLDGAPLTRPHPKIATIFQDPTLLPWRTVEQNIALALEFGRGDRAAGRARIADLLRLVGLEGFAKRYPQELSGGMQQRVAIVRGLVGDPEVLLLDEPFSALDPFTREEMNLMVQDIWMRMRKTVILVTHSIEEALLLSDRIVVLSPRPGRISDIVPVDLPRPRGLDLLGDRAFHRLAARVRNAIAH